MLEAAIILAPAYSDAYNARLERAGAFTEREKRDEAYRRRSRAERVRTVGLPRARELRGMDRANRERDAAKARRQQLWLRRDGLYRVRHEAIRNRVMAQHKIRPPGKAPKSIHAFRDRLGAALQADAEYRALTDRECRADRMMEAIQSRRSGIEMRAGVLAVDDQATRRAKVAAWHSRQSA